MKKTFTFLMLSACLGISAKSIAQLSENFEGTTGTALPAGWTQNTVPTDSTGWKSGDNTTLGSTYYAMNAHTRFVGVNDDAHQFADNGNELLKTPSFSLVGSTNPYLSFDCCYTMNTYGGFTEAATVEASTDGGATWTVVSTLAANSLYWWEPRYISLSAYAGMSNVMLGFRYKDNTGWLYGFCIDNVNVFTPPANDLGLTSIAPMVGSAGAYALTGGSISMTGSVFNYGSTAVSSYQINYLFNTGSVVSNTISGTIAPFTSANFTDPTAVTMPATAGAYPIRMWVSLTGDANATNDSSAMDTLTAVTFMPTKKLAIEEATGTWCGWCVRGIVYMDSLKELYGNGVSLVAVHDADPMTVTAYDTWMGTQISGYPSVVIDRTFTDDPSSLLDIYTAHHADFGFADITITPTWTTSSISVATSVKPALDLNGDYRLVMVLTEDRVHGAGSTWDQHNYYSSSSQNLPLTGQGVNYQDSTNPIPAASMYFNHVGRVVSPSVSGTAGVLPSAMTAGSTYTATLSASIPSGDNINFMHCIVMLVDNATGHVLNTQNADLTLGVANVNSGVEGVNVYPNPAVDAATVRFDLQSASKVSVEIADVAGRVVSVVPSADFASGANHISISTSDLAAGVYNVKVITENGVSTQKLTVIK